MPIAGGGNIMRIEGIGIDAHLPRLDGNLEVLEHDLAFFQRVGFDYVEIPVHGVDAILGGRLNERRVRQVQEIYEGVVLLEFKPRYSPYFEEALQETGRILEECGGK
jgi:hypothetical protein